MRHMLGKHSPDAQNAIPVAETNIGFVTSDCLCEIVEKIRKLNIGFVTTDCLCGIVEKIWKMNIGFVTSNSIMFVLPIILTTFTITTPSTKQFRYTYGVRHSE